MPSRRRSAARVRAPRTTRRPAPAAATAATPSTASTAALRRIGRDQARAVGYLLIRCGQLWNELAIAEVNAQARAAGRGVVLREAHTRLFPYLTAPDGVRIVDLARTLGVSKQAVQPLVAELDGQGFVYVRVDPADARARRVYLTPAGAAAFAHGTGVLRGIESRVAAFGTRRLDRLRAELAGLLPLLEHAAALHP